MTRVLFFCLRDSGTRLFELPILFFSPVVYVTVQIVNLSVGHFLLEGKTTYVTMLRVA